MGRPKQLLAFRGTSLLRHAAAVALAAGCEPVVVALGSGAGRLRDELGGLEIVVAENPHWQEGPGTSTRAAASVAAGADAVVFLLCDQPLVNSDHIRALIAAHRSTGRPMAASGYAGTVGVPALFARECFGELQCLAPAVGAKQLLARARARARVAVAVVSFPEAAIDLDTFADYERLITSHQK